MKKKESKVMGTFTLVFVLCCLITTSVWAAKKIDILSANAPGYTHRMNIQEDRGHSAVSAAFGFGQDEKFTLVRKRTDFNNITHSHFKKGTYNFFPFPAAKYKVVALYYSWLKNFFLLQFLGTY